MIQWIEKQHFGTDNELQTNNEFYCSIHLGQAAVSSPAWVLVQSQHQLVYKAVHLVEGLLLSAVPGRGHLDLH